MWCQMRHLRRFLPVSIYAPEFSPRARSSMRYFSRYLCEAAVERDVCTRCRRTSREFTPRTTASWWGSGYVGGGLLCWYQYFALSPFSQHLVRVVWPDQTWNFSLSSLTSAWKILLRVALKLAGFLILYATPYVPRARTISFFQSSRPRVSHGPRYRTDRNDKWARV
jgi:hypothetical protein